MGFVPLRHTMVTPSDLKVTKGLFGKAVLEEHWLVHNTFYDAVTGVRHQSGPAHTRESNQIEHFWEVLSIEY